MSKTLVKNNIELRRTNVKTYGDMAKKGGIYLVTLRTKSQVLVSVTPSLRGPRPLRLGSIGFATFVNEDDRPVRIHGRVVIVNE